MSKRTLALLLLTALVAGCARPSAKAPPPVVSGETAPAGTKESLNEQAFAQIQAKNWTEAIRLAEQAVRLDANYAPARYNLGLALYRAGKFQEALPHLQAAYDMNKQQVEPGWFLALDLRDLGQKEKAVTLLRELGARFPDDPDVKQELARLSGGGSTLTWTWTAGDQVWDLRADRMIVLRQDQQTLEAVGQGGAKLWSTKLPEPSTMHFWDGAGKRVMSEGAKQDYIVDVATGKLLVNLPTTNLPNSGKGNAWVVWQGEIIYVGADNWGATMTGGGRYESTDWKAYRLSSGSAQQLTLQGARDVGGQKAEASTDGSVVLIHAPAGPRAELFRDFKSVHAFDQPASVKGGGTYALAPAGDTVYFLGYEGDLIAFAPTGEQLWGRKAPAGYKRLKPWRRAGDLAFIAATEAGDKFTVLTGKDATAFSGEGAVVTSDNPRFLVARAGDQFRVIDGAGKVVGTYGDFVSFSRDGRSLIQGSNGGAVLTPLP